MRRISTSQDVKFERELVRHRYSNEYTEKLFADFCAAYERGEDPSVDNMVSAASEHLSDSETQALWDRTYHWVINEATHPELPDDDLDETFEARPFDPEAYARFKQKVNDMKAREIENDPRAAIPQIPQEGFPRNPHDPQQLRNMIQESADELGIDLDALERQHNPFPDPDDPQNPDPQDPRTGSAMDAFNQRPINWNPTDDDNFESEFRPGMHANMMENSILLMRQIQGDIEKRREDIAREGIGDGEDPEMQKLYRSLANEEANFQAALARKGSTASMLRAIGPYL